MALVTRLSGVPSTIGFDLYDALLFALTVVGAFGVVYNLVASRCRPKPEDRSPQPALVGRLPGRLPGGGDRQPGGPVGSAACTRPVLPGILAVAGHPRSGRRLQYPEAGTPAACGAGGGAPRA